MNDTDYLHGIIDTLPQHQVQALLTLLEPVRPISNEEFVRILANAPEEEIDDETGAELLAAEAEEGPYTTHDEMKRLLGL